MSQRHLLSASDLRARVNKANQTLILFAKGITQAITYNITFSRLPSIPEIRAYELVGWTRGIGFEQPYERSQTFEAKGMLDDYVVIVTADSPQGRKVPIIYADPLQRPAAAPIKPEVEGDLTGIGPVIPPRHEKRLVLLDEPFEIKAPATLSKGGEVRLDNDSEYISLLKANIEGGELVWTLSAIKFGTSEVIVSVFGGEDPSKPKYYQVIYEITVLLLSPPGTEQTAAVERSFLKRVDEGVKEIQKMYPDAKLLAADAKQIFKDIPAKEWWELGILTITCAAKHPRTGESGSVSITSWWNESWSRPKFGESILGLDPFTVDGLIDADKAQEALQKAGYTESFGSMALTLPNLPLPDQPYYFFSLINGKVVRVGAKDGVVQK